jgi:hypothetical protein
MFDSWIVMIVALFFRPFKIQFLGPSVVATLIFETILTFKVGLEAFRDSSLSFFNKKLNLIVVVLRLLDSTHFVTVLFLIKS